MNDLAMRRAPREVFGFEEAPASSFFHYAPSAPSTVSKLTALILAGGLGIRLRPVVADRPKVLAPVGGTPFLSHLLRQLARAGVPEAVLLVGHGSEQVRAEFGDFRYGVRLRYSVETELLGTAGAARLALPMLRGETILLMNGDSYCDLDFAAFTDRHHERGGPVSVTVTQVDDASRFGRVALGSDDRVLQFEEKKPDAVPGWINAGIYLIARRMFDAIPSGVSCSLERDLLPSWTARHEVFGFRGGAFIDIGVPESYARADAFFRALR